MLAARAAPCAGASARDAYRINIVYEKSPAPKTPTATRNRRNGIGSDFNPTMNDRFDRASTGRSRTNSQNTATAVSPGTSVHKNTCRYDWPACSNNQSAVSGPAIAPIVSINRSNPNARPYAPGGTSAARSAFLAGDRTPRPSHASVRPNITSKAPVASPKDAVANAVTAYPNTASGFRAFNRSVKCPAASFVKLDRPSATPSITPSQAGPAPISAKNAGSTAVAVS